MDRAKAVNKSKDATKESGEAVKDIIDAITDIKEMRKEVTSSTCIIITAMDGSA